MLRKQGENMHRHDDQFEISCAEIVGWTSRAEDMRMMSIVLCAQFFPRSHSCMACLLGSRRGYLLSAFPFCSAGREAHDHRAFFIFVE